MKRLLQLRGSLLHQTFQFALLCRHFSRAFHRNRLFPAGILRLGLDRRFRGEPNPPDRVADRALLQRNALQPALHQFHDFPRVAPNNRGDRLKQAEQIGRVPREIVRQFREGNLREDELRGFVHSTGYPVSTMQLSRQSVSPEEQQREDACLRGVERQSFPALKLPSAKTSR